MKNIQNEFLTLLYQEFKEDSTVDSWPLVNSLSSVCIIVAAYLTFVLKLGPKIMEKRESYNIKYIIIVYNIMQTLFNSYILTSLLLIPGGMKYFWNYSCHPDNNGSSNPIIFKFYNVFWLFAISKIFDLLDTVFFILRKKQSHVSFLHVYHHANVVITSFFHVRFIKDINVVVITIIINSFIHVAMYSYYFLSTLGPNVQKFLWWKKYLTLLQIIQFIVNISFWIGLVIFNCTYPRLYVYYLLADVSLFLYLFLKFYNKTYKGKNKSQ